MKKSLVSVLMIRGLIVSLLAMSLILMAGCDNSYGPTDEEPWVDPSPKKTVEEKYRGVWRGLGSGTYNGKPNVYNAFYLGEDTLYEFRSQENSDEKFDVSETFTGMYTDGTKLYYRYGNETQIVYLGDFTSDTTFYSTSNNLYGTNYRKE